ncbi:MAG: hypothetical protein K2Y02_12270, partial [Burkholderiaceae bacterium]|nr:hypothetical protein [Burkholderiaceae bacterium]
PVQITYLGYPTTTGVGAMDYRISDGVIDPLGADTWSSETILRCDRGMFCYQPDGEPEVGALPALRNGHVTFGSFNNLAKLSPQTLELWSRVLHCVPQSRLLLKAKSLASATVRMHLLRHFEARGIGAERLVLNPWRPDLHSHLDLYREVDIGLDTYPYNGATTTCESLWMGVPVVSLRGATHVSRMGASILQSAGFGDWAASLPDEYVEMAVRRAGDLSALAELRCGARDRLRRSALMDTKAHTADLERLILSACEGRLFQPASHRNAA